MAYAYSRRSTRRTSGISMEMQGAWIGWTMATTPPPKPIEEIEAETRSEAEEKSDAHAER